MADLSWVRNFSRNRQIHSNITTTTDPNHHSSSNHIETVAAPPIHTPTNELLTPPNPPSRSPDSSPSKHRFRSFESLWRVSSNILNSAGNSNSHEKHGHQHAHSCSPFPYPHNNSNRNTQPAQRVPSSLWTPAPIGALPLGELDPDEDKDGGLRRVLVGRRGEASTWHNPNLMQMVETLRAVMIRKHDPLESIPIVYNSYVLSLIEGFAHINQRLESCQGELDELKKAREMELEQFRAISEEWMEREEAYKAEIKRLELILAKESKNGVASVALARHESLVDRSGTKRFKARLDRVSNSHERGNAEFRRSVGNEIWADNESITDWTSEDFSADIGLEVSSLGSSVPRRQYSLIGELPRRMDQARDVRVSRAVERHERSLQRSPPKDWRRQHPQVVAGVDDDAVSPSGTYRHLPCRPVEDQSPEKEEQAFSHVKKRSKPGHTIFVQPPQEYGNVQQRQRGGESPSPANKYAWDDAEYSTSGESMATTEDGSLAQSGMDGTVDNMLKVQPGWGFDDSRGLQRETVGQMTTAGAGAAGEGSYCGRPSLVPSPSRQKRHQNRLTAIRSPMVRPPSTEVPRESGEGYANASKADAGTDAGTDAVIPNRRNDTESSVANEGRHDARKDMSGCRQGAQLAQQPRSLSYRRTISASTGAHSGRRYSFDKGDDEVLPVSSPVSTGEQGESDDSRDIYPPRQQDLSLEHVQVQEGTSQRSDRPTVAPSTSTGSVVWVGGVGDEKEGQAVTERAAGVPKITTSRVSDDSGDDDARLSSLGDPIGVRTSVATGGTPSLSPSSSSLNLRSSLDVNGGGRGGGNVGVGHAARIAAQRAVAGKNGGGTR